MKHAYQIQAAREELGLFDIDEALDELRELFARAELHGAKLAVQSKSANSGGVHIGVKDHD